MLSSLKKTILGLLNVQNFQLNFKRFPMLANFFLSRKISRTHARKHSYKVVLKLNS